MPINRRIFTQDAGIEGLLLHLDAQTYSGSGNWLDSSGNGHDATINGATFTTNGSSPNESYFDFDGSDDFMTIPQDTQFDFDVATTMQIWVNKDGTGREWVIEKANGGSGNYGWQLEHNDSASNYRFQMHNTSNAVATAEISTTTNTGDYTHIAVTHNGSNEFKIYLNGSLEDTATLSGTISKNTNGITIGKYSLSSGFEFDGRIAMVKFHLKTLSDSEVLSEYNSTKATFGL